MSVNHKNADQQLEENEATKDVQENESGSNMDTGSAEDNQTEVKTQAQAFDEGGLVPEAAMNQMQQDAVMTPKDNTMNQLEPAAAAAIKNAVESAEKGEAVGNAAFHQITFSTMFTLDLTSDHMVGLKDALSSVALGGQNVNLYSPFRKGGKKKGSTAETAPDGIMRYVLNDLLDVTDAINDSRIMFVGKESDVMANLRKSIDTVRTQIEALFPERAEGFVANIQPVLEPGEELSEEDNITLTLGNIVKTTSWINSPRGEIQGSESPIAVHNAMINFHIQSGALYDSTERVKHMKQIESVLRLLQSSRAEQSTNMLLAVNIDPAMLADSSVREFLDEMLSYEGYVLYTRNELHKCDVADWMPQSKASVDRDLLSPGGEILLILLLRDEDETDFEGDQNGAAPSAPVVADI